MPQFLNNLCLAPQVYYLIARGVSRAAINIYDETFGKNRSG